MSLKFQFPHLAAAAFTAILLISSLAWAAEPRQTRDLVFEDDAAVTELGSQKIMVKTTLDLTRDGKTVSVLPTHTFKSGDKVKLRYSTNADGYVYWMAKMSSGQYSLLYPTPQTGTDNFIKKNTEYTIPVKGSFRFDNQPGKESLLMIFSPDRIDEMEKAVAEVAREQNPTLGSSSGGVAGVERSNQNKRQNRDLVFEDEDDDGVNTKSQVGKKGEPFVANYELSHN